MQAIGRISYGKIQFWPDIMEAVRGHFCHPGEGGAHTLSFG